MSTKRFKQSKQFVRASITIPAEIAAFAAEQSSQPEHAGNMSSYVRSLIIRDIRERQLQKKAA
jgi:hypothetical protein